MFFCAILGFSEGPFENYCVVFFFFSRVLVAAKLAMM